MSRERTEAAATLESVERPARAPVGPERLPSAVGNRAFAAMVARSGAPMEGPVGPDVTAAIAAAQGGGQALETPTRRDLEAGFGEPLGDVRLHTGPDADSLARSVDARAFTVGRDIWFADGEYAPGSDAGRALVAHEVAHAVQQGPVSVPGDLAVTTPGDATETEADHLADTALARTAGAAPTPDDPHLARSAAPRFATAATPDERAQGLKGAEAVPDDGMMFEFGGTTDSPFTMEGVGTPLDLVTVDGGGRVSEVASMEPGQAVHQPEQPYDRAIEVPLGGASRWGFAPGTFVARWPAQASRQIGQKIGKAYAKMMAKVPEAALEKADNITSAIQGVPAAAQVGQLLAAGANGMSPLGLPTRVVSGNDQNKLKQIVQFEIINAYCKRFLELHPDAAEGDKAAPDTPPQAPPTGGGKKEEPPKPAPKPAGGEKADDATAKPTGAPTADAIDAAMLEAVSIGIQSKLEQAWQKGRWPEGHEYVWGEDNTSSVETIGVTGSVVFTNLVGQALSAEPKMEDAATKLGVQVASPGKLNVRMIVGGTLRRGGKWTNSWFDNLAVNAPAPTVAEEGPERSASLNVGTTWDWDDNQTVWDFVITVDADGSPKVEDKRNGEPDDSKLLGWGKGGTPQNLKPTGGGTQNFQPAARAARRPPAAARQIAEGAGALLAAAIEFMGTDLAAAISASVQAASAGAAVVVGQFQHGQNGCATLTLPTDSMSSKDQLKLRQVIQYRVINEYSAAYLQKHPELAKPKSEEGATPPGGPAPKGDPKGGKTPPAPPPAPSGKENEPPAGPTGAAKSAQIDDAIADAVKNKVALDIGRAWVRGVALSSEYIWGEDNTNYQETVGVTGAVAFSQLRGEVIFERPMLKDAARTLGLKLPDLNPLYVRRINGGKLGRSGSWSDSWWDNLAVNIATPVATEDGVDDSIVLRITTDWLWDDNSTVWDFAITVREGGTPFVEEQRSGTPDDSSLLGSGEGGTPTYIKTRMGSTPKEAKPGAQNSAATQ